MIKRKYDRVAYCAVLLKLWVLKLRGFESHYFRQGSVPKWIKGAVCKTVMHGFDSRLGLMFKFVEQGKSILVSGGGELLTQLENGTGVALKPREGGWRLRLPGSSGVEFDNESDVPLKLREGAVVPFRIKP